VLREGGPQEGEVDEGGGRDPGEVRQEARGRLVEVAAQECRYGTTDLVFFRAKGFLKSLVLFCFRFRFRFGMLMNQSILLQGCCGAGRVAGCVG
jgi:hypothetical protein